MTVSLLENLHIALPEMIVLVTACIALLGDLFSGIVMLQLRLLVQSLAWL